MSDALQLEMNISHGTGGNRFKDAVDSGKFTILIEHNTPGADVSPDAARERLLNFCGGIRAIESETVAMAITDRYGDYATAWRALEYASMLPEDERDRHVVYLSGRGTGGGEVAALLRIAAQAKLLNVIFCSGDAPLNATVKEVRKETFSDSVNMVEMLRNDPAGKTFFPGVVINPFKYTPSDLFAQYFKMIRKFNAGAAFAVAQSGWDMLKLQALRWYLAYRNCYIPTIARLTLLSPEKVEKIESGVWPGIEIAPEFRRILNGELKFSRNQFEAAQWRRLELQAAGCRLLGYSGVQISGVETVPKAQTAVKRIEAALKEFSSFEQWLQGYHSYLARPEMISFPNSFYLFDRKLSRLFPEGEVKIAEFPLETLSARDKRIFNMRKFFFEHADRQAASDRRLLKRILAKCRGCSKCRLNQTFYICTENCPKRLPNGPCGQVNSKGHCIITDAECIHALIMRLACWQNDISSLEDNMISSGRAE